MVYMVWVSQYVIPKLKPTACKATEWKKKRYKAGH